MENRAELKDLRRLKRKQWAVSAGVLCATGWASYQLFKWMQPTEEQNAEIMAKMDPIKLKEVQDANQKLMDHLRIVANSDKPLGYYERKWKEHQFNKLRVEYPYEKREEHPHLFPEDKQLQERVRATKGALKTN
ncbi:uncharacterized protein LOC134844509 [Symsagittifera roscoffensis]|uniref:uncharacterized protein LOC134844509 n=1 Tax=Symsagittifera roscoffensis TaxID=84072 RepID=UPI00307BC611